MSTAFPDSQPLNNMQHLSGKHAAVRLLVVGQAGSPTGFGRVVRELCDALAARGYEIHVLGLDVHTALSAQNWTLHPNRNPLDPYAWGCLEHLVDELCPALVLLLNDFWLIPTFVGAIRAARHQPRIIGYVPIDGQVNVPEALLPLQELDGLVLYTQFGKRVVTQCAVAAGAAHNSVLFQADVIPHGINTSSFYPLAETFARSRQIARQEIFGDQPELQDAFIVLNANRNQLRKRFDIALEGFALFARSATTPVRLYLHTGLKGVGYDIQRLARSLEIEPLLLLTEKIAWHPARSDDRLNLIYNACDVGLNTATGEGWGLVSFEHAATGAAQVVPRHSACEELWQGAAALLTPVRRSQPGLFLGAGITSPEEVAQALSRLSRDVAHREQLACAAYANATRPEYQWERIAAAWNEVFQRTLLGRSSTGVAEPEVWPER